MRSLVQTAIPLPAREHKPHIKMLRAVASLELTKGLIVLGGIFGILFLVHKDPGDVADWCLTVLHISPDHHFAQVFLDWADSLTDKKLWVVAGAAAIYSILRFVEAYGLWKARAWAEWIALISGTLYVPFEIFKIVGRPSLFHVSLLVINLAVVLYMAYVLWETKTAKARLRAPLI
ncbi:MAG: DUF2127 domain-containing protein [Terriglobales bacterium]